MSDRFWLTAEEVALLSPLFPKSHVIPRVDDRRVLSGIIHVIRNGLRWRDAPPEYGPHKTLYNRFARWSAKGVFQRIFAELAALEGPQARLMMDATNLKAHRTAASLKKGGPSPGGSAGRQEA